MRGDGCWKWPARVRARVEVGILCRVAAVTEEEKGLLTWTSWCIGARRRDVRWVSHGTGRHVVVPGLRHNDRSTFRDMNEVRNK